MANVKAMEEQIKIFFGILDQIDKDLDEVAAISDRFERGGYYSADRHLTCKKENCKPYDKNPLLQVVTQYYHHTTAPHNVRGKSVILWQDADGRNLKYDEFVKNSEKLKIVHEWEHYQFALIRTDAMFTGPTDTIWANHFRYKSRDKYFMHDLALIDTRTKEIVHASPRRWEFEQLCLNQNKEDNYIENVHDFFTQFEPFKMSFWNLDELDMDYLHDKWNFWIDQPSTPDNENGKHYDLIKADPKDRFSSGKSRWWLCGMIGRRTKYDTVRTNNTTWFYVYSPDGKPSKSLALRQLMTYMEVYDHSDFVDLMKHFQENNVQLSNIPLECAERMRYGVEKLRITLDDIFGWDFKVIVQKKYYEIEDKIKDGFNKKEYIKLITFK